jgi:cytosine/adenosine deaminase-related metal-dependent hydrolase
MSRTKIRNLSWIVGWNGTRHVYLHDGDVVFEGNQLIHVGGRFDGAVDREVDGTSMMAMPGFVNVHGHLGTEPLGKGFYEELGSHKLNMSRIYEYIYTIRPDKDAIAPATQYSVAELMKSGCTTVSDMGIPYPGWIDVYAGTGVRAFLSPMFRSAQWHTPNDHEIEYLWDEAAGERGFVAGIEVCDAAAKHPSGRIGGIVMPSQVDTCTPELIQKAYAAATARNIPFQTHLGQAAQEFDEIVRRHGKTPISFLHDLGVLGPTTTIAHGIFLDEHPQVRWHEHTDLARIAETGTSIVHCPQTFAYRGMAMHSLGAYHKRGVKLAIGTDTFPHDILNEMRLAITLSKVISRHVDLLTVSDLFHMATIGGANSVGRPDLGRLAANAKADLVLVDLDHPKMAPMRDPLRSLVFSAGSQAIRHVFVDGAQVVEDGVVKTIDVPAVSRTLTASQQRALADTSNRDWAKRKADQISPLALETQA